MKRKLLAAFCVAAVAAACAAPEATKSSMRGIHATSSSIVGGSVVSNFNYPFVVFIEGPGWICTGTLIDDFVVLTAAHCIEGASASQLVAVGADDPYGEGYYWIADVASAHIHPQWNSSNLANDIGILVLAQEPAQEDPSGKTHPIPYLASDNGAVYDNGQAFTAVGFGITSGAGNDSGIKREVGLSMTQIYLDIFEYGSSTKNTCSGDSGGPALVTVDGEPTVVGVVSYGDQNCTQFGGDSRTDYFADYIAQFAGAGATPTPTPNPGGGDDDDDGSTPGDDDDGGKGNEADDPFGNVGCSIGAVQLARSPAAFFALLAVAAVCSSRRRKS